MAQFMVIDGVKGNVTTKDYVGAINLSSAYHINERDVRHRVGNSNKEIGIPSLGHLQITKDEDAASAKLLQYFYEGKSIPKVEITRCSMVSGKAEWQSKITLNDVMITKLEEQSSPDGGRELLNLSFGKIQRSFRSQNGSGEWQTPMHTGFNIETAEVA